MLSDSETQRLESCLERRNNGEPVAYITGTRGFWDFEVEVNSSTLIPRPETEELAERVIRFVKAGVPPAAGGRPFIVDVGTGSGCIILSLARELGDGVYLGTDISPDAVALAQENAARCGLAEKVRFAVADGLDEFDPESVDVIVSNPPYIASAECETLDPRVKDFEPRLALDGGETGLDFYDRFVGDAMNVLKPGGAVFFEIGEGQGEALRRMLADYGFGDIRIEKDFAGHDRYASGSLCAV